MPRYLAFLLLFATALHAAEPEPPKGPAVAPASVVAPASAAAKESAEGGKVASLLVRDPAKGIVFCAYNIENYVGNDQAAPAGQRARPKTEKAKAALLAILTEIKPDVLGVSEMGSEKMFEDFKARLARAGLDYPHSEYLQAGDPDRHVALVSRFPIVARHSEKHVVYTLEGEEQEMKRGILDVTVQVTPDYQLRCVGVHLKSKLPTPAGEGLIRRHEAAKLREHLDAVFQAAPDTNLICYGDCNDTKNEPMFAEIAGVKGTPGHLANLWAKDSVGDRWTHYWRMADQYSRIDYLFVSLGLWPEVKRETATVFRSPTWFDASDRPLYVTIVPKESHGKEANPEENSLDEKAKEEKPGEGK